MVNGKLARPGQPVGPQDDVRLDGRRLRLGDVQGALDRGLVYHRPAQEEVRGTAGREKRGSLERLPKAAGRRWIPISPLSASDGGLELFLTDGRLAAALMRRGHEVACDYSVRVRGKFDEMQCARVVAAAAADPQIGGKLTLVEGAGGEGSNRWVQVNCIGLRPRDLKKLFESCGFEVNRVIRTRLGPITMDRALARGRSRSMTDAELAALHDLAESELGKEGTTARRARG
jgi:23S rRNA pseudouridine2605 synthase